MPILKVTEEIIGFRLSPEGRFLLGPRIGTWHGTWGTLTTFWKSAYGSPLPIDFYWISQFHSFCDIMAWIYKGVLLWLYFSEIYLLVKH